MYLMLSWCSFQCFFPRSFCACLFQDHTLIFNFLPSSAFLFLLLLLFLCVLSPPCSWFLYFFLFLSIFLWQQDKLSCFWKFWITNEPYKTTVRIISFPIALFKLRSQPQCFTVLKYWYFSRYSFQIDRKPKETETLFIFRKMCSTFLC